MSEEKFPSQLAERFQIRLPDGMRDRLRDEAAKSGRSMNAEIIQRLEKSFGEEFDDETVHRIYEAQRRLLFHVLNYAEQVPTELAVWAHDMVNASNDEEMLHVRLRNGLSRDDAIAKIVKHRTDRSNEVMAEILRRKATKRQDIKEEEQAATGTQPT